MRILTLLAGAFCLAGATAAQGAGRPLVLEPSSDWVLDYAKERCTLVREFGEDDRKVALRIDSFGSWLDFRVTVFGKPVPKVLRPTGDIKLRFTPDAEERDGEALFGTTGNLPTAFFSVRFGPLSWREYEDSPDYRPIREYLSETALKDFEENTTDLRFEFGNRKSIDLRFSGMSRPMKALRDCIDNLHESWGLDPVREKSLAMRVRPTEQTVAAIQRRFPSDMLVRGKNGYIPVRIMVDAQGRGSDCVVQVDSAEESFREAVCKGLSRTFQPALDQSGAPVASVFHTAVIYLIG